MTETTGTTPIPTHLDVRDPAIRARGLVKRYGRTRALDGADLTVPRGSVYVLVGPNGAGKTTTLKLFLDLVRGSEGEAEVFGFDPVDDGPEVRSRIGWAPESQRVGYAWSRVSHLLDHHAAYHPAWDDAYARELAGILEVRTDARFGDLSKGQARRVQLLMALAARPPLLLLDEPTDGLDPVVRDRVLGILAEHIADTGTTMVISTHLPHEVEGLAGHLGVMRGGRIVAEVSRDVLREKLLRYEATVPEGWSPPAALDGRVVRREGSPREISWTIWGSEEETGALLRDAGAGIRQVSPVTLEKAALALLSSPLTERS